MRQASSRSLRFGGTLAVLALALLLSAAFADRAAAASGFGDGQVGLGRCVGGVCDIRAVRTGLRQATFTAGALPDGSNTNTHLIVFNADLSASIEVGTLYTHGNADADCGGTSQTWVYYVKWQPVGGSTSCNTFGAADSVFNVKLERCGSGSWQAEVAGVIRGACHSLGFDFAKVNRSVGSANNYAAGACISYSMGTMGLPGGAQGTHPWSVSATGSDGTQTWADISTSDTSANHSSNWAVSAITGNFFVQPSTGCT
jgi:hypothetical protein